MYYRKEIDGLRAIAVLPVIFFHAGFDLFGGGFVGVDVFFVISGYLITSIILREQSQGKFTLIGFYERRARRILPPLALVMLCSIPLAWLWMLPSDLKDFGESLAATALGASNILFWSESGYFAGAAELKPLLHTWSLALEEQYYVLLPIFILTTWRVGTKRVLAILALVATISLATAQWGSIHKPSATFYLLPTRGWELLLGVFIAFYLANKRPQYRILNRPAGEILSALGMGLILYSVFAFDERTPFPSIHALLPTVGTAFIILFGIPSTLTGKLLSGKLLTDLGLISYSLYLWHHPLFAFARIRSVDPPSTLTYGFIIIASLGLSYASWRHVESYFRNRSILDRRTIFYLAFLSSMFFIGVGALIIKTDGFKNRFAYPSPQLLKTTDEFGNYVPPRFNSLMLHDFDSNDQRKKLLVIGDSFGKDMVNIIYESSLKDTFQVSTHHIESQCGNLLLEDYSPISDYIDKKCLLKRSSFLPNGRYDDPRVLRLISEADHIWLSSSWSLWEAKHLRESIERLRGITEAKITVIGTKNFPGIDFRQFLSTPPADRAFMRAEQELAHIELSHFMKNDLSEYGYLDLNQFYCDRNQCRLFDEEGNLISYDGGHLTKEGAAFFGRGLEAHFTE